MKKADLIDRIASNAGISRQVAATAFDTTMDGVKAALKKGQRVDLGFGTFSVGQRRSRSRNPQTGDTIKIIRTPIRIRGRFATPYDTAKALGVPPSRVNTLISRAKKITFGDVRRVSPGRQRDPVRVMIASQKRTGSTHAKFTKAKTKRSKAKG